MPKLFDTVRELKQDVLRNIVNIPSLEESFSDLFTHKKEAARIANIAISRVMKIDNTADDLEFHYTNAIHYPFETDHFMASRYSDGTFPVWYGSMEKATTIAETVFHMIKEEMNIFTKKPITLITRERVLYDFLCKGILIDLTEKKSFFPHLYSDDYTETQQLGKHLNQQGYPGLLTASVRHTLGTNVTLFKSNLLSNPRIQCKLTYRLFPQLKKVEITEKNKIIDEISW